MKLKYETPLMKVEVYETNAYCGSCDGQFQLNGTLTVSPNSWSSSNNSGKWSDTRQNLVPDNEEKLKHTFIQANSVPMTDTWGNPQYFWKCSDGDGYYLEYSAYYTQQNRGTPTFFLYKEVNGKEGLQISGGTSWPLQERGKDLCVAQVVYTEGTSPIVNS